MNDKNYIELIQDTERWLYLNGTEGMHLFNDMFEMDKEEYIEVETQIDIALDILRKNKFFKKVPMEEFIESNDALFAVEELIYNLDTYDLPRAYIILLPIELFYKALEFLLETLEELELITDYYDIVYD